MANEEVTHLFSVPNHHFIGRGKPPKFNGDDPDSYYSYFENCHGEQLIFEFNRDSKQALLWHGDVDWEPRQVVNGMVNLILSEEEHMWLQACHKAVTAFDKP